jgi:signal transduction histidine kinase/CheY-like chemotaxis protein
MQRLVDLLTSQEEWLLDRVVGYARAHGFTQYTSTLPEAWRASIVGLTSAFCAVSADGLPPIGPDVDTSSNAVTAFGMREARLHRQRGVPLHQFLALMKYYRQAYHDCAAMTAPPISDAANLIDRFFDHVETGFCREWAAQDANAQIDELRVANKRLAEEKVRYVTIFESLPNPTLLFDGNHAVVNANYAAVQQLTTLGAAKVYYDGSPELQTALAGVTARLHEALRGLEAERRCEYLLDTPHGPRYYQVRLKRMSSVTGLHAGTVATFINLTERQQTEDALRDSALAAREFQNRLRALHEVSTSLALAPTADELCRLAVELGTARLGFGRVGIWLTHDRGETISGTFGIDEQGHLRDERRQRLPVHETDQWHSILHGDRSVLLERQVPLLDDASRQVGFGSAISTGLWNGEQVIGVICADNFFTPETPYAEAEAELLQLYAATIGHLHTLKNTEEERRHLEAQILHAQKLESLGVLAGGIAHDFNNLLMGIIGNASIALMRLSPESPVRTYLEKMEMAGMRAADLAKQMLAYSGKGQFMVQPLNLSNLVEEMTHLLEVAVAKNVVLKFKLAEHIPAIDADATQVRQVVMNLLTNASDAIGERSGVISITTGAMHCSRGYLADTYLNDELPEGPYVYLEISDTGCGMSGETRARIFDPFFTTKFTGRGLGLAAVLGIVRGHRGAIKVYSEVGHGTTFKVLFPYSEQAARAMVAAQAKDALWQGTGGILLIDDDETVRMVSQAMLKTIGFTVHLAEDGVQGMEVYRTHADEIRVVLLDMTMPHMNGEETFRALRALNPDARVILSSGYNETDATTHFAGKGLAGFIQKPYTLHELSHILREVLEGTEAHG